MELKKLGIISFTFIATLIFFLRSAPLVEAFFLEDWFNSLKKTIVPPSSQPQVFSIDSDIALAPDGDVNKNGAIDAGDIVTFAYTIKNTTDQEYAFGTLKTGIDRKQVNFIHNVKGAASLDDTEETVNFPNLRVGTSLENAIISFDARINYVQDQDILIATEPEFISSEQKSVNKATKKEVKAKRIDLKKIPQVLELRQR